VGGCAGGGSAVDSVEAAVRVLEDNPRFNAGYGSVLNEHGEVEMDALVMSGLNRALGAVTGVRCSANPITVARAVMEQSPHTLLAGAAADSFAARIGLPQVPNASLVTPARSAQLTEVLDGRKQQHATDSSRCERRLLMGEGGAVALAASTLEATAGTATATVDSIASSTLNDPPAALCSLSTDTADVSSASAASSGVVVPDSEVDTGQHDTVGAVAVDALGHTAAATSTGGLCGKWPGRVGDSPLVGCGGFAADDAGGAVSTTGTGELITRFMLAREVACEAAAGRTGSEDQESDAAASAAVAAALRRMAACGLDGPAHGHGAIFVTPRGSIGIAHSSERMSWAFATALAGDGEGAAGGVTVRAGVQLLSDRGDAVRSVLPSITSS
jgi:L-asparaginase / beta-aspartyl-peptidase